MLEESVLGDEGSELRHLINHLQPIDSFKEYFAMDGDFNRNPK
jgi:hypothetical protein